MFGFNPRASGVLEVTISGLLNLDEADRYITELRAHVETMRRKHGYSLVLVDGRENPVQPQYVMAKMETLPSILITNDKDRAAYVVVSSLAKLQAQRLSTADQLQVFLSASAAQEWLLANHVMPVAS